MSVLYPGLTHQIGGNTAGATANISSGTYLLAGGNNITLSQNGNTVTISAGAGGGGSACYTQDLYFYEDARKHGYRFACDTRVKVGHYDYQNDIVW